VKLKDKLKVVMKCSEESGDERRIDMANKYAVFVRQSSERGLIECNQSTNSVSMVAKVVNQTTDTIRKTCAAIQFTTTSNEPQKHDHCSHSKDRSLPSRSLARGTSRPRLDNALSQFGSFRKILDHLEGMFVASTVPPTVIDPHQMDLKLLSPHMKASLIVDDPEEFRALMSSLRKSKTSVTNMGLRQALMADKLDVYVKKVREKHAKRVKDARLDVSSVAPYTLHESKETHALSVLSEEHSYRELYVDFLEDKKEASEDEESYKPNHDKNSSKHRGRLREIEQYPSLRSFAMEPTTR